MSALTSKVRVRFAPSPTGDFHVGGARTALYDYLFARRYGGSFILRIEDTDRNRYDEKSLQYHMEGLRWLGLDWDEGPEVGGDYGPYFQSQRLHLYKEYAERLVREGHAYYCFCSQERLAHLRSEHRKGNTAGYDRHCRNLTQAQIADLRAQGIMPVVRLKAPLEGQTSFDDVLRGHITVENDTLDDMVLLKSDGFPTYHLAAVIDDHFMEISHIMRGDEWLTSVPQRIVLYQALGWSPPIYVHLPTILDPSGKGKLSKRKKYAPGEKRVPVFIREFRDLGYLPEAMVNYLARVGWSFDDKTEVFDRDALINSFDLSGISKSPAVFSYDKLDWMNGVYIRGLTLDDLSQRLLPFMHGAGLDATFEDMQQLAPLIRERITTLAAVPEILDFFFEEDIEYDPKLLIQKKMDVGSTLNALEHAYVALNQVEDFFEEDLEVLLRALSDQLGLKVRQFLGVIRVAVTGRQVAPPLFGTLVYVGRKKVLQRITQAQRLLREAESTLSQES